MANYQSPVQSCRSLQSLYILIVRGDHCVGDWVKYVDNEARSEESVQCPLHEQALQTIVALFYNQ